MEKQIILGESTLLTQALEQLSVIAPLNKPVLIVGERGTGKELVAERLHFLSSRWQKPYLKINCAAMNDSLLDSTLFGHEAGAFTGAIKASKGYFERANEGTLFLDELATVSTRVQEKLLRVIEYGEFERLGGQQSIHVDVRIIGATNADLVQMAKTEKFRADLLDRLAFDVINLPPLRYRPEDILILAEHFAIAMSRELRREVFMGFSNSATNTLLSHQWPGNIRELKNVVQRSVYRQQDSTAAVEQIILDPFSTPWAEIPSEQPSSVAADKAPDELTPPASDNNIADDRQLNLKQKISAFEVQLIQRALQQQRYHQNNTADALGITYHQLRAYLKKYPELSRKS
ncbi:MAG: phage shock protein operon transcriptional activator [Pseudomonadales bacterium]|nr:phage shock protein operon transcriptional activator [Pseudomonadales bacterium]NRA17002.1 phage shock protein operon transcriptional activator [Oceanospirillaceae bacterium]